MSSRVQTTNPANGQMGQAYEAHDLPAALGIARAAKAAVDDWRFLSFAERAVPMRRLAGLLRERREKLCALMTAEMGKTLTEGLAEIEKCAAACEHFAEQAASLLADQAIVLEDAVKAFVTFNPLGVVLAVMPWNFPFWQVIRFAAPALMAGNGAILKHASNVPGCALELEKLCLEAGFPKGLFGTVLLPAKDVAALIADPFIAAVTLTGSVGAGRKVAAAAGAALKKTVLELGGSDAYLILEDADIAKAAKLATTARMVNGGQSCIAGKRFIVAAAIKSAFEDAMAREMVVFAMGDPNYAATKLGPMYSVEGRDALHDQVQRSLASGARLLTGGVVPDQPGAWYPATVLTDCMPDMAVWAEETFGPVAAIMSAKDEDEAIAMANASNFGLGSGVITQDLARGERIAAVRLEAGMAFVNSPVRSDVRLPFGGVKDSGYGRECAEFGIREFTNIKTVVVRA